MFRLGSWGETLWLRIEFRDAGVKMLYRASERVGRSSGIDESIVKKRYDWCAEVLQKSDM
jgi:hypothetical protein